MKCELQVLSSERKVTDDFDLKRKILSTKKYCGKYRGKYCRGNQDEGAPWKFERCFDSENASNVFRPHYTGQFGFEFMENSSTCRYRFRKASSVHTKLQSRRFQIPPVRRAFSESCVFVTD